MADTSIIVATVGADDSNSYVTVADADAYFATRLDCSSWTNASNSEKEKALVTATRQIDMLNFKYVRTYDDQALAFPRTGTATHERHILEDPDDATPIIPTDIIRATCEQALYILYQSVRGGTTSQFQTERKAGVISKSIGDVSYSFNPEQGNAQENELCNLAVIYLKTWINRARMLGRG